MALRLLKHALRRALTATVNVDLRAAADVNQQAAVTALRDLIADGRARMLGAVRQELLCGIKSAAQFGALRAALKGFEDVALAQSDCELAAEFFNTCRSKGVQGGNTDFLICAAASVRKLAILTTDRDFVMYGKHLPVNLYHF